MISETTLPFSAPASGSESHPNHRRTYTDIRALERALLSANLAAAREAFNRLQEDSPHIAAAVSRDPFSPRTWPMRALRVLGRFLLRGNLNGARRAFEWFS